MQDSLDLPVSERGKVGLQHATIKSPALAKALAKIEAKSIARAFPSWQNKKDNLMERSDGKKVKVPPFHRIFTLTFNTEKEADSAIDILKKSKAIVFAEKNSEPVLDNDEHYIDGTQWYLNNNGNNGGIVGADINAEGAWAIYTGNANNNIAIIDAGVELTHEDLTGKVTGDTDLGFSHGTLVAGVAAARANNTHGIRGVDWNAQIISKRIYDANNDYLGDAVTAQKITDAVNEGADVLNCSWSSPTNSSTLALAFAYAYKMNRVSVATMGNTWTQEIRYPGAFGNVMAVGATQNDDTHSPWSTTGSHVDVAAPGGIHTTDLLNEQDIFSTTLNNDYDLN
jgi:thermitase